MTWTSISHTPDFELPEEAPPYPEDVRGLIEEWHEGLTRIVVSKKLARNKYNPFATITCQDPKAATKKSHPTASPEEIAEYVMYTIQHEIDETDDPGIYKVTLFGPPGKGRFERSKHVDLTDTDGMPRSITMMNEGELHEQQSAYIGELHGTIIGLIEIVQGNMKTVVQEHRELTKIVSESVRKNGELEAMRLNHELQLRMAGDEAKQRELERDFEKQKWTELLNLVNESGAPEAIMKAIMRKVKKAERDSENASEKKKGEKKKGTHWKSKSEPESGDPKKKAKKKTRKRPPAEEDHEQKAEDTEVVDDIPEQAEEAEPEESEEDMESRFFDEGMDKIEADEKGELLVAAEALKMSIDVKKQWKIVRETLSEEQYEALEDIFAAPTGAAVEEGCVKLYELKGAKKLIKLQDHLDERQQQFVDILLDAAL